MTASFPTPVPTGVSIFTSSVVTSPSFSPTSGPPDTSVVSIVVGGVTALLSLFVCVCCILTCCCIVCQKRKNLLRGRPRRRGPHRGGELRRRGPHRGGHELRREQSSLFGELSELRRLLQSMPERQYRGERLFEEPLEPCLGEGFRALPYQSVDQEMAVYAHSQTSTEENNDSIRGVEVVGETNFVVSAKECSFEWEGYGLRLGVSEDSLPTDMEECRINIKASLSGPFELPEDSDLLSPVFWISALCKFKKPVTLEIQHCASRDEASFSDLNFISSKCSQKTLPYTFKQLDGGKFPTDSSYGSIQLHHFSGFGITGKRRTPWAYCAQIYYTIKEEADWRVYFIITKDLDTLKTVVGKDYCLEETFQIKFEHKEISLDIPGNGEKTKEGWRITPHTYPLIISKKDVDKFKLGKSVPPKCVLLVEWDLEGQKPVRLRYKINFIGAKEPKFFHLRLNPTYKESDVVRHQPLTSSGGSMEYSQDVVRHQPLTSSGGSVEHSQGLASKYPAGLYNEPELPDLMNEVAAKIPGKWRDVGLQLGVDQSILEGIATVSQGDTNLCYSNVFTRWKNQNSTTHPYTWSTVVQALKAPAVVEERLADKISAMLGHHRH